ncbi:hypothetical protein EMIHUDRAFT_235277 [Emiliania huxleyi CCMP1516]|uniref:Uncharacterized protein n=2 Tax=Emiliania huxleyi TaxID=2903 RepID=A0A0D3JX35_EMIH1|nr:hypothetical protein EMIHUDRAFT_235277 [Emiliania huxleyi CCMP1516]EOD28070.1 hypothetical protein EMIHUDRAFT_235277 [Emiliania huxleyi CCMP1516]|eukprot:XP_005780499.1 hypothetical protein EMIHUDRAFT_235277 [Emiliania huxleyi CCMP1516]
MSLIINERSQPTTNELIIMMGKPRKELEEKLRSQTKLAAAQELRRSDRDNLRTAQQAAKRDIKAAERMADEVKHAARADFERCIGEMRAKMQAERLREQLDALQISMEAEARRADAAARRRGQGELHNKMEGIMHIFLYLYTYFGPI